jgi:transporter family-2 protein
LALVAALGGAAIAAQSGTNSVLAARIGSVGWTAAFSAAVTSTLLAFYALLARAPLPVPERLAGLPWWAWLGGPLGAAFLFTIITTAPRIGATAALGSVIAGQLVAAALFDHFGLLGFAPRPLDAPRLLGIALLLAGVALLLRR